MATCADELSIRERHAAKLARRARLAARQPKFPVDTTAPLHPIATGEYCGWLVVCGRWRRVVVSADRQYATARLKRLGDESCTPVAERALLAHPLTPAQEGATS